MDSIKKAIRLIQEGRWFEALILILMIGGVFYFLYWWNTGRWKSKGKCSSCRGVGTVVRRNGRIEVCPICKGTGKPNDKEGLRFSPKTKKSKKEVEIDFSQRILCRDGNCIGIINEQGVCNTCGKPYTGEPD
jgi:hypothetical protein